MTQTVKAIAAPGRIELILDTECELCEAAPLTEWFFEDDLCWIAECEMCAVPMVVWRDHAADPPAAIRDQLLARLSDVVDEHFGYEAWIDDNMRSIPDHYHAHARPRGAFYGHGLRRRQIPTEPSTEGTNDE